MRLLFIGALIGLGACSHAESPRTAMMTQKPATVAVQAQKSTCSDSFDHALSNLTRAMKVEGNYALSQPVYSTPAPQVAPQGRISRY